MMGDYILLSFPSLMPLPNPPSCINVEGVDTATCSIDGVYLRVAIGPNPTGTIKMRLLNVANYLLANREV